jgi:hypothetical protein
MSCPPAACEPQPTAEASQVDWWTKEKVTQDMAEAFAVRILDALTDGGSTHIRHNDGVKLV